MFWSLHSPIAQLVERRTVNPQVPGSSPGRGAMPFNDLHDASLSSARFVTCMDHSWTNDAQHVGLGS